MKCMRCKKEIEKRLSLNDLKIDLSGIEQFSPKLQEFIKDIIISIHAYMTNLDISVDICSNECYNYMLYSEYDNFVDCIECGDEMLKNIDSLEEEIEKERVKNRDLQSKFIKEKMEYYRSLLR